MAWLYAGTLLLGVLIGSPASPAAPDVTAGERGTIEHAKPPEPVDTRSPSVPGPPANLKAGVFKTVVEQMWRTSPSFRRQCARLAGAPALTVTSAG